MTRLAFLLAGLGLSLAACYSTPAPECAFACSGAESACPDNYTCRPDGLCKLSGVPDDFACPDIGGGVDAPVVTDGPDTDGPDTDGPDPDAADIDATPIDAPAIDAPAIDAPAIDAPAIDAPAIDAPVIDAPDIDAAPPIDAPAEIDAQTDA